MENKPEGMRLAEFLASLSLAIDLGVDMPMEWVLRTCLLSMHLGKAAGLDVTRLQRLYYQALLMHVGCTSTASRTADSFGTDMGLGEGFQIDMGNPREAMGFMFRNTGQGRPWPERAAMLMRLFLGGQAMMLENHLSHCEIAERLAERLGLEPELAAGFRQINERWDGKGTPARLRGNAIALEVRVLQMAQDAATLHGIGGAAAALDAIGARAGKGLDPDLAVLFKRDAETLLAPLAVESVWDAVLAAEPGIRKRIAEADMDRALLAAADYADFKTPYTLGHSRAVAATVAAAASRMGLGEQESTSARRAALLMDLGRVGVSASIWKKPGTLNDGEWEKVRLHPYYTERILARSPCLAALGRLAGLHHERMDGSGYHHSAAAAHLPQAARLLGAADAYQAMQSERSHRPALAPAEAATELRRMATAGKLDAVAVEAVLGASGVPAKPRSRLSGASAELSPREIEVLRHLARGRSNRQTGESLFISGKTVGHHVQHIYAKIGVSTRAAATLFAMENGLLGSGPNL